MMFNKDYCDYYLTILNKINRLVSLRPINLFQSKTRVLDSMANYQLFASHETTTIDTCS